MKTNKKLPLFEEFVDYRNQHRIDGFPTTYDQVLRLVIAYSNGGQVHGLRIIKGTVQINDDLTVDVDGDVNLQQLELKKLPLKFGKVSGNFNCSRNKLESLDGAPHEVGDGFYCSGNKLESLDGVPKKNRHIVGVQ